MDGGFDDSENPYRPPDAPPLRAASGRAWLRIVLGIGCILFACVGLTCIAAGMAMALEVGDIPNAVVRNPRGRLMPLLLGGFAVGTARWFVAARACFRGEWRAAITNATLGLGFVVVPLAFLISRARQ